MITTTEQRFRKRFIQNVSDKTFTDKEGYYQHTEQFLAFIEEECRKAFWQGYDAGVDSQIAKEHLLPFEASEIFRNATSTTEENKN
jgi:hypothetical protein